jgi:hypothetical protein
MMGALLAILIFSILSICAFLVIVRIALGIAYRGSNVSFIVALLAAVFVAGYIGSKMIGEAQNVVDIVVMVGVATVIASGVVWLVDVIDRLVHRGSSSRED